MITNPTEKTTKKKKEVITILGIKEAEKQRHPPRGQSFFRFVGNGTRTTQRFKLWHLVIARNDIFKLRAQGHHV
jgi:hypothetical protein